MRMILGSCLLLLSFSAIATAPSWQIVPAESHITFTATQNNSPVSGKFKIFQGEINADQNQLADSKVYIVIDTDSVSTDYSLIGDTLKTAQWLDAKKFPQAVFEAHQFQKTGPNAYQANGTLTLKGKTLPVVLNFVADISSQNKAVVKGSTELKRTAFDVGQGDFKKTTEVKDNVKVDFVLTANKN